ncbi:MAG: ribonuclease HIII [Mycoplasmataceae bacterium]|jgi:ribonuclease HIII|nr:ribonuclease HIII [Mycoplasmataceae bacterium]
MQNFSVTLNSLELTKVLSQLGKYRSNKPNSEQILYFFKVNGSTITIYKNKRLLIQGSDAEILGEKLLGKVTKVVKKGLSPNYIGCDEVGVGDYFGGLVTCAVYLKKINEVKLKTLGVRDSKNLTDEDMLEMFPKLTMLIDYAVMDYLPCEYNALVAKYHNTHIVKTYMHDQTIKTLITKCKLSNDIDVVMDQYVDESTYYDYFKVMKIMNPAKIARFETKAENKYLAVAAASIIARVTFLKQIQKLSQTAKQQLLLGASNPKIITQAKEIYRAGGNKLLAKYVKIDFRTTDKVVSRY